MSTVQIPCKKALPPINGFEPPPISADAVLKNRVRLNSLFMENSWDTSR